MLVRETSVYEQVHKRQKGRQLAQRTLRQGFSCDRPTSAGSASNFQFHLFYATISLQAGPAAQLALLEVCALPLPPAFLECPRDARKLFS